MAFHADLPVNGRAVTHGVAACVVSTSSGRTTRPRPGRPGPLPPGSTSYRPSPVRRWGSRRWSCVVSCASKEALRPPRRRTTSGASSTRPTGGAPAGPQCRRALEHGRTGEAAPPSTGAVALGERCGGSDGTPPAMTKQAVMLMLGREAGAAVVVGETAAALARERGDLARRPSALEARMAVRGGPATPSRAELTSRRRAAELAREVGDDARSRPSWSTWARERPRSGATRRPGAGRRRRRGAANGHRTDRRHARAWQARTPSSRGMGSGPALARPLLESADADRSDGCLDGPGPSGGAPRRARRAAPARRRAALARTSGDLQRLWPVAAATPSWDPRTRR